MSAFGRPPGNISGKPTPPEKGSFPLDHEGECKAVMLNYLTCIKKKRGMNDAECRELAKGYLTCRMDHNLMTKEDLRNLGFPEEKPP